MIIVVEGPSGAGKTTGAATHGGSPALLESLPDGSVVPTDGEAAAHIWVERNVAAEVMIASSATASSSSARIRSSCISPGAPSERVDDTAQLGAHA